MDMDLSLTDVTGRTLIVQSIMCIAGENLFEIELENLSKGLYIVKIKNDLMEENLRLIVN